MPRLSATNVSPSVRVLDKITRWYPQNLGDRRQRLVQNEKKKKIAPASKNGDDQLLPQTGDEIDVVGNEHVPNFDLVVVSTQSVRSVGSYFETYCLL